MREWKRWMCDKCAEGATEISPATVFNVQELLAERESYRGVTVSKNYFHPEGMA